VFASGSLSCRSSGINGLILAARILWAFNLSKARYENGKEIDVDTFAYTDSEVRC
jgi:hypothetical protein